MRRERAAQLGLVIVATGHVRGRELEVMGRILDDLPAGVKLVHRDLVSASGKADTGRDAMAAEQVLRAMVVKHRFGSSYEDLAFQLADSNSIRSFCRIPLSRPTPTKSTLQRNIKRVRHVEGCLRDRDPGKPGD